MNTGIVGKGDKKGCDERAPNAAYSFALFSKKTAVFN